jgi:precorrin-8X/cobalt-precorrin-8 methylmutase
MFDRFVVVDWSANSTPKLGRDSIWVAQLDAAGNGSVTNLPTRRQAEAFLGDILATEPTLTTLVGVDFSLGYPAGTATALAVEGTPWSAMWSLLCENIVDDDRNANNRFAVAGEFNRRLTGTASPFWGCPPSSARRHLTTTKPPGEAPLAPFRATEAALREQGRRPFSSWQLFGAGSVGSQSLLGIPVLERLRVRFGARVDVWPFTTGLQSPALDEGAIVLVEVWPSMRELGDHGDTVRDAAQVRATANWLADTDAADGLGALFTPSLPRAVERVAVAEEGWVLGVVP